MTIDKARPVLITGCSRTPRLGLLGLRKATRTAWDRFVGSRLPAEPGG